MTEETTTLTNEDLIALEAENQRLQGENNAVNMAYSASTYGGNKDSTTIQYQLDPSDMLERLEHFLRGDKLDFDAKGSEYWKPQKDQDLILFNDYGVNSILAIV